MSWSRVSVRRRSKRASLSGDSVRRAVLVYGLCKPQPEPVETRTAKTSRDVHTWERPPYVDADFYPTDEPVITITQITFSFVGGFRRTHGVGVTDRRGKERWGILEQLVSPFYLANLSLLAAMVSKETTFWGLVEKTSCQRMKLEMYDV